MEYRPSMERFRKSKMFDANGNFHHLPATTIKLFPYVTHQSTAPVLELKPLVGSFLCRIESKSPVEMTHEKLVEELKKVVKIQRGQEELFSEMIRQMFFAEDGMVRPLNLQMMEQIPCIENNEDKVADYLVDVLGESDTLRENVADAKGTTNSNVLEALVLSKLKFEDRPGSKDSMRYFRVVESLRTAFEEDFAYVLQNSNRLSEHLVELLEWYYFSYTAQSILQLRRFMNGERNSNIPLYFCLEWEKTSQNRLCYTEGWQKLQSALEALFAHAITLQILNQTEDGSEPVDYISLREIVSDEKKDFEISEQIDAFTALYRATVGEPPLPGPSGNAAAATESLFDSIRGHFENNDSSPYRSYARKFESYCKKFLKSRGRSGRMLSLSEENLIFLTRLCIKNQERMRLKDVFTALERRGIFLDDTSKEQVADYYEKLNLIEKKSDSGDAMYVKRIL